MKAVKLTGIGKGIFTIKQRTGVFLITSLAFLLLMGIGGLAGAYDLGVREPKGKAIPRLEWHVQEVYRSWQENRRSVAGKIARLYGSDVVDTGEVKVILVPAQDKPSSSISQAELEALGIKVLAQSTHLLRVSSPVTVLEKLTLVTGVSFVRFPMRPAQNAVTSEGVSRMGADRLHAAGSRGAGAKVAIFDGGFEGVQEAVARGDLPATWKYFDHTGAGIYTGGIHGTACAEIVYDTAPDAEIALVKVEDLVDLENAKDQAVREGYHIVSHSMAWLGTGFGDGKGRACDIVNDAYSKGIVWINSAGNYAQRQYTGLMSDPEGNGWHNFDQDSETLPLLNVEVGDEIDVWLTWNDWPRTSQDYDLHLYFVPQGGDIERVVSSRTVQNASFMTDPTEHVRYEVTRAGTYHIAVLKTEQARTTLIKIWSANHEFASYSSITGTIGTPGDAKNAIAVGAMPWGRWYSGPVEEFSSRGPTVDGRIKPDLVAPDGVTTFSYREKGPFSGTSAAAPHIAGIAALIKASDLTGMTPDRLKETLLGATVDMGASGKDNTYGYGRIDVTNLKLQQPTPAISVSTALLSFGEITAGDMKALPLTISSTGKASLSIEEITSSNSQFILTSDQGSVYTNTFDTPDKVDDWRIWNTESSRMENGAFVITGAEGYKNSSSQNRFYQGDIDVTVETTWVSGVTNNGYGIEIRGNAASGYYAFLISRNGSYVFTRWDESTQSYTRLIDWTGSSFINVHGKNTLRITAEGGNFQLFINNKLVNTASDDTFQDGYVRLRVDNAQEVSFDNLVISQPGIRFPLSIQPATSQALKIYYTPLAQGNHQGTLSIRSNDPDKPQLDVTAIGTAKEATVSGPPLTYELLVDTDVDADAADRDRVNQGAITLQAPRAGETFQVELYAPAFAGKGTIGYEFQFGNNGNTFSSNFSLKNVAGVGGLAPISSPGPNSTGGGVGSLSATNIPSNGYIGTVIFQAKRDIPAGTRIEFINASIGLADFNSRPLDASKAIITFQAPSFAVSADLDASSGDQGLQALLGVRAASIVSLQIFGTGIQGAVGFGARLEYDGQKLAYDDFTISSVFPNANSPGPLFGSNPTYVEVSGASLGGKAAVDNSLLGTVKFKAKDGFSDTQVKLVMVQIRRGGEFETIYPKLVLELVASATPDFDGDGTVGFRDFLLFAEKYGSVRGDGRYDAKFDLDGTGDVGFGDFVILAQKYGKDI